MEVAWIKLGLQYGLRAYIMYCVAEVVMMLPILEQFRVYPVTAMFCTSCS